MAHKDICIPFTITGGEGFKHRFALVGFLKDGERSVTRLEAIQRVGSRAVRCEDDWALLCRHIKEIPSTGGGELHTRRMNPGCTLHISSFINRKPDCNSLDGHASKSDLVLCRGE
jgi:hypothetical protein